MNSKTETGKPETGSLGVALLAAGVVGVGRGRGPIRVRRFEVEQIFLDNRDRNYTVGQLSHLLKSPPSNMLCHLRRMLQEEILVTSLATSKGERQYRAAISFTKLSGKAIRQKHGAFLPSDNGNGVDKVTPLKPLKPSVHATKIGADGGSISLQIAQLKEVMDTANRMLGALSHDYTELKSKVEGIL